MAGLKLSFVIEAIDRATAPVRAVNQRIDRLTEPARRVRASFNALVRESGLTRLADQAVNVSRKFQGVTGALRGIAGAALIVGGAAAAMWIPVRRTVDQLGKINDIAATIGMSARDFQRLAFALTLDGSSAEDAATALQFLQNNAVQALTGSKEMATWFRRAGISAEFLKKSLHDPQALLFAISDGLTRLDTAAQRIAVTRALMGRSSAQLVQTLSRGTPELKRLGDEAERLGDVLDDKTVSAMDEAGDSITRMERSLGGVLKGIAVALLPAIERISKGVMEWAVANRAMIATRVSEFIERLVVRLPSIVDTTWRIVGAIGAAIVVADRIAQVFGGWENVVIAVAAVLGGKLVLAIGQLAFALAAMIPTIIKFGIVLLTTPIGWFLGAIALLAGAVYLIYRNWTPISEFFISLWDGVKTAFSSAFEWIAAKVRAVTEFVSGAILKLDAVTPEWVKKWTLPGAILSAAADAVRPAVAPAAAVANAARPAATPAAFAAAQPSAVPSALPAPGAAQADVGGTINIKIDQEGRARVAAMKANNPGVDFDVDAGPMFVMP